MEQKFCLLLLNIIISFSLWSITFAHSQTPFQGKNSILSQEEILTPFPLKHENNSALTLGNFWATLTADKNLITDGGNVKIMVVLNGIETNENDVFTIHCGPQIDPDDILDAVAPSFRDSFYAEVDFYDLTYMRCDYTFSYLHFLGDDRIHLEIHLEIPSEDLPTAPKQPHLIYASNPNTMKVMYVSSSLLPYPMARYWKSDDSEDPGTGQCQRPSLGCKVGHDIYKNVDCDGDGILDHACSTTINNNRWLVLSSEGCPSSWGPPTRPVSMCPQAFGGMVAIGTSEFYDETAMCQEPANQVAQNLFRNPGFTHTVEMVNLEPDTRYSYMVGNDEHGWSNTFNFKSAPDYPKNTRFVAFGDQEFQESGQNTSYNVKREVEENGSEFTIHFGDLGYAEGKGWVWDKWGSMVSPGAAIAPYMVSVGNHELDHSEGNDPSGEEAFNPDWCIPETGYTCMGYSSHGECGVPTLVRWGSANPEDNHGGGGNKMWYSFDWGNVHVIMMDSEHDWQVGSNQYSWLEADLAAVDRSKTPWVVVTSHRPIYSTVECEPVSFVISSYMKQALDPLFEKYQVNLALVAHTHSYERTCLIKNGNCVENGGTLHITVGTGGADLSSCGWSPDFGPYSKVATNQFGYLRVEATQESMILEFVLNSDETVWDAYEVLPWN